MKILGINASPKGKESQTLRLVNSVLRGAESEGAETEIIDLYSLHIEYCTACGECYATGECPLVDDYPELFDRMIDADAIVLGSPNYIDSITAPLKAVFDRMADAIHCQMLSGKYGCSVCTAGGSGQMEVVKYMNQVLTSLGATAVGGVGVAIGRDLSAIVQAEKDAFSLGQRLAQSVRGEHRYPEQDEIHRQRREYFCRLITLNKTRWAHEYDWWVEKGEIRR
ncbi:MAG: flavodoxin family protein [Methanomicrobiales archaeon]|nr:flavodoxin family protein [Methanomicrobiales archaeon]